jgi:hypothetical protein
MVSVSLVNSVVWTAYAVLKKDIPLFMTNFLAFTVMSVNLVFYLWAVELIATEQIWTLINFFKVAFPDLQKESLEDV